MNRNSNTYTVIYATVLTVLVAVVLSVAALGLKQKQQENSDNEKKQQVLSAISEVIGKEINFDNAADIWAQLDMDANMFVVDPQGRKVEGANAFDLVFKQQFEKGALKADAQLPVFKATIDGRDYYIMSLYGAGLWDAIWGYMAVEADGNTVAGATFDHAGETAGLGAKIKDDPAFAAQFIGKHLFKEGEFTSVSVLKAGKKAEGDQVDAVTGATMTSNGVSAMILSSVGAYVPFLQTLAAPAAEAEDLVIDLVEEEAAADSLATDNVQPVNE